MRSFIIRLRLLHFRVHEVENMECHLKVLKDTKYVALSASCKNDHETHGTPVSLTAWKLYECTRNACLRACIAHALGFLCSLLGLNYHDPASDEMFDLSNYVLVDNSLFSLIPYSVFSAIITDEDRHGLKLD